MHPFKFFCLLSFIFLFPFFTFAQSSAAPPKDFILVEGGTFMMGREGGEDDEQPVHKVTLKSFYVNKFEVTQGEWKEIMGDLPCKERGDLYPVSHLSFTDALIYCNKRSIKEGRTPCYTIEGKTDIENSGVFDDPVQCDFSANGYRLLTEAEWEYAARGGKASKGFTFSGSNYVDEVAWYKENSTDEIVHPVGTKAPNELGIFDMSGNVDEWCWDKYDNEFYQASPEINPSNRDSGTQEVYRGGCYYYGAANCAVYKRNFDEGVEYIAIVGLRLAVSKP